MRILVCEDHPMCCEGFVMAFQQAAPDADIHRVGSLADADRLLDQGEQFDVVLTDLILPDSEGLQSLVHFRNRLPDARVAVATGSRDAGSVARARSLGAVGFVPKASPMPDILHAIRQLVVGEEVFPTEEFANPDDPAVRLLHLTRSQLRMVMAAARGQLNKQIAFDHGLTEATVKSHLAAAFKKLGVANRVQAGLLVQSLAMSEN